MKFSSVFAKNDKVAYHPPVEIGEHDSGLETMLQSE